MAENSLDIIVYNPDNHEQSYTLRAATEAAIELRANKKFMPLSFSPELISGLVDILQSERQVDAQEAHNTIYIDLNSDFGRDIADETFRYYKEYFDTFDLLDTMFKTGMTTEAMRILGGGKDPISVDPENLDEAFQRLVDDIQEDSSTTMEATDEDRLDDIWNNW